MGGANINKNRTPAMPIGRRFSTIVAALLALAACWGTATAQVANGNAYTIGGIDVDVGGADAIKARDQAVREAKRRAVGMLVERMVAPEDRKKVPPVDDARLEGMIRGVEFAKERSSANRFSGTLNVVFAADQAKSWLSEAGITVAETVARPALVVPLWKDKNGVEPLDDRNAWRDAWSGLDSSGSAVPLTVVRGDQLDQNAMSVEEAYVGDVAALTRLNERYRLPTIIVAIVEGDKDTGALTVGGYRYDTQTGARSELPTGRRWRPRASSPTPRARSRRSSTPIGAAWPSCAAIRRMRWMWSCRSARLATGSRCASVWARSLRSRASSCARSKATTPTCASTTTGPPTSSSRRWRRPASASPRMATAGACRCVEMSEASQAQGTRWRFWLVAAVVFLLILWRLNDILLPFVVGMVLAYFFDPLVARLQRNGPGRARRRRRP